LGKVLRIDSAWPVPRQGITDSPCLGAPLPRTLAWGRKPRLARPQIPIDAEAGGLAVRWGYYRFTSLGDAPCPAVWLGSHEPKLARPRIHIDAEARRLVPRWGITDSPAAGVSAVGWLAPSFSPGGITNSRATEGAGTGGAGLSLGSVVSWGITDSPCLGAPPAPHTVLGRNPKPARSQIHIDTEAGWRAMRWGITDSR
jgi:hypothetical protein